MWVEPKINWVQTDFINVSDYERMVGNIAHLNLMANEFKKVVVEPMAADKTYLDMPYASEWNAIEHNVQAVNINKAQIEKRKTWVAGGHIPDYSDLNRLEEATLDIYNSIKPDYDLIPRLSVALGGGKIQC